MRGRAVNRDAAGTPPDGVGNTRSDLSGQADNVVQARDVSGGVHFHASAVRPSGPVPRQLPGDIRGFVNRTATFELLNVALRDAQASGGASVFVITGTAGVGKTSLAVRWAHQVRPHFPDGQLYVNLRGYDPGEPVTAEQALERFLLALNVPANAIPDDGESRAALYRSLLADRRVMIVLDNAATVGQVRPLLPGVGESIAVVTGRSRLSGLMARDGARRIGLDVLTDDDAVELLLSTMSPYRSDDVDEVEELARLCARLPLALRIAAERAASRPNLSLDALINDLRNESSLWDTLSTDDEEEEEATAVRSVFAWSYRALSPTAATLFRCLGLHPSPEFSTHAAAVLIGDTLERTRPLLDQLAGAHLIEQTGPDRYQFHDLLRAYATDEACHAESADDRRKALHHLLSWYLATTLAAMACVSGTGAPQPSANAAGGAATPVRFPTADSALNWLHTERDNLSSAVREAATSGFDDLAWQVAVAGFHDYVDRCSPAGWHAVGLLALGSARRAGDRSGEAQVLECLGIAARLSRQLPEAIGHHTAALAIHRERNDRAGQARSINALGLIHARSRDLDDAVECFGQAMTMAEQDGDTFRLGIVVGNLGNAYYERGDTAEAERLLRSALAMTRSIDDRYHEADTLHDLSKTLQDLGHLNDALECAEQALAIARDLRNQVLEGALLTRLGDSQRAAGHIDTALICLHSAAVIHRQRGDTSREATTIDHTGHAYRDQGRLEDAIDFHRRAAAMQHSLGDRWRLVIALNNFATALHAADRSEEADDTWHEALTLASAYQDRRATALRESMSEALGLQNSRPVPPGLPEVRAAFVDRVRRPTGPLGTVETSTASAALTASPASAASGIPKLPISALSAAPRVANRRVERAQPQQLSRGQDRESSPADGRGM